MKPEEKKTEEAQPNGIQRVEVVREIQKASGFEVDPLMIIEQRNRLLERVLEYAIRATHAGQWVDQGGQPWPTAPAAEVMARRCAVSVKNVHSERVNSSDDKGAFYYYKVEATASLPGDWDSLEAIGTCSSRDQFLGTETSAGRPLSDIDEGNILKAAYSNMMVNGVTRLLGMRRLTWEKLAELGIERGQVAAVDYQKGARGGGAKPEDGTLRFGKSKGKAIPDLTDKDLAWYRGAFAESVADPEKSKWKAQNEKMLGACEAEIQRRKAGAPKEEAAGSVWDRVRALAALNGVHAEDVGGLIKRATKKTNANQLTEADIPVIQKALDEIRAAASADIPF